VIERPCSRIVRLVLVESNGSGFKIQIGPRQGERLTRAHALAREESVEQPVDERHARLLVRAHALEEREVLLRVEVAQRDARSPLRQEPARKGGVREQPARVDGQVEDPDP
jgi:hypothetical protein